MQSVQELFFVIGAFVVELFTIMIWLNVQQERNWEFMMYIRSLVMIR